jgi:hypothetical protein
MKPCWLQSGLTEEGVACADRILEAMIALVENAGPQVARVVALLICRPGPQRFSGSI